MAAFCSLWDEGTNILRMKIRRVSAKTSVRVLGSIFSNMAFHKDASPDLKSLGWGRVTSQRAMKPWERIWQWGSNWNRFVTFVLISFACGCLQNSGCACGNHKSSSYSSEEQTALQGSGFREAPGAWWTERGLFKSQITQFQHKA